MQKIKILLFANLRERNGGGKYLEIEVPDGTTVRALKERIASQSPGLKDALPTALVAVDHEFAADETVIPVDAEVALFPPVSGG